MKKDFVLNTKKR